MKLILIATLFAALGLAVPAPVAEPAEVAEDKHLVARQCFCYKGVNACCSPVGCTTNQESRCSGKRFQNHWFMVYFAQSNYVEHPVDTTLGVIA
ncbi:hypothetical protein VTK73DRAFT_7907 [Phialemonium thermophilum]|uniref:Uncharacterized protein n=1 Tax=Phialemonium thermophilum TaxID=223376 RepID=A0ABR3WC30_9PEZI